MRYAARVAAAEVVAARFRPRPPRAERVSALLEAPASEQGSARWWDEAEILLAAVIGAPRIDVGRMIEHLVATYVGGFGPATELAVIRAALHRCDDWAGLDDPARLEAVETELAKPFRRELILVASAVKAHGLPVAAPQIHPPLLWSYATTDRLLNGLTLLGLLESSSERGPHGWPMYVAPPPAKEGA
jgi:hypothetical protein